MKLYLEQMRMKWINLVRPKITIWNLLEACVRRICYVWANPTVYNLAPVRLGCTLSTMEWNNPSTWHNCCRDYEINCQVSSYQFFGTYYLRQLFFQPLLSNLTRKYFIMTCNNISKYKKFMKSLFFDIKTISILVFIPNSFVIFAFTLQNWN